MIGRFNGGIIHAAGEKEALDNELAQLAHNTAANFEKHMENMEINAALKEIWVLVSRSNKYIDETAPWTLAKDPAKRARLDTVMYNLVEVLRIVTILISPFMPTTAPKIWAQLGIETAFADVRLHDAQSWGMLPAGTKVAKPEPIFPRIEEKVELEEQPAASPAVKTPSAPAAVIETDSQEITIDEFGKMDLRVAKVLTCEKVKGADKLLQFTVDLGTEERTVVSGIAKYYKPEDLVGRNVVMVANLKPAKIRGIESRGMLLSASCEDKLILVDAPDMPAGSRVK
jgi:methionyl-tRNA synthetase